MGDEGEAGVEYKLVIKDEDGETRNTSKDFDGLAIATHVNGDIYAVTK